MPRQLSMSYFQSDHNLLFKAQLEQLRAQLGGQLPANIQNLLPPNLAAELNLNNGRQAAPPAGAAAGPGIL